MVYFEIFLLSLALSADAFSVGASVGLLHRLPRQLFRLSFHFGLFQSLLALAGALLGATLLVYVENMDHWIAFILLAFLGLMMIYKSIFNEEEDVSNIDLTRGFQLIGLSIAVSIDAFAAGVSLPTVKAPIIAAIGMIGIVSGLATFFGMIIADHVKSRFGKRIEIVAGLVLIALGIKVLFDHHVIG